MRDHDEERAMTPIATKVLREWLAKVRTYRTLVLRGAVIPPDLAHDVMGPPSA